MLSSYHVFSVKENCDDNLHDIKTLPQYNTSSCIYEHWNTDESAPTKPFLFAAIIGLGLDTLGATSEQFYSDDDISCQE